MTTIRLTAVVQVGAGFTSPNVGSVPDGQGVNYVVPLPMAELGSGMVATPEVRFKDREMILNFSVWTLRDLEQEWINSPLFRCEDPRQDENIDRMIRSYLAEGVRRMSTMGIDTWIRTWVEGANK